jgi:hypothetical protein
MNFSETGDGVVLTTNSSCACLWGPGPYGRDRGTVAGIERMVLDSRNGRIGSHQSSRSAGWKFMSAGKRFTRFILRSLACHCHPNRSRINTAG